MGCPGKRLKHISQSDPISIWQMDKTIRKQWNLCMSYQVGTHLFLTKFTHQKDTHTVDGRNPAPPKKIRNDESPVITTAQWFLMVSKWCGMDFVHPRYGPGSTPASVGPRWPRRGWVVAPGAARRNGPRSHPATSAAAK